MESGRRDFLSTLALGTLGAAGLDLSNEREAVGFQSSGYWNLGWVKRLKGRYRAVFDIPVIEDGFGVWRAVLWRKQYAQVFGVPETSLATVVILRHDAIALALNQDFWTRYDIGARWSVRDPATGEPTKLNPLIGRTGDRALPPQFAGFTLETLMEGGAIVLGCAMALRDCATLVASVDRISDEQADRRVRGMLIPGAILQPSGVFAAVLAQDNGCRYVRAS
jgi:hypothetical protein